MTCGYSPHRRDDRQRPAVRAVPPRHDVLPARLHLRRPPGLLRPSAMANLDIFEREGLNDHVKENAPIFRRTLEKLLDLPIVGDVRGAGYFYGIELVKDKATRETFDDDESERLLRGFLSKALFDAGLYCRADDRGDPVVQLAPPLIDGPAGVRRDRVAGCARCSPRPRTTSDVTRASPRPSTGPLWWDAATAAAVVPTRRRHGIRPAARRRRRHRRRRLHRAVDGLLPAAGPSPRSTCWCSRPSTSASARAGATAAGSRRSGRSARDTLARRARPRRRARPCSRRCATRSTRSAGSTRDEGIDCGFAKGGALVAGPHPGPGGTGPGRGRATSARGATARSGSTPRPARERLDAAGRRGRDLHPALRPGPPAPARRRPGRGRAPARGAASSRAPRVDRAIDPGASCSTDRSPGHGPARRPRHRGLDRRAARARRARGGPRLLAHGGHRAARRRALGAASASPAARSSPTTGTSSSTASAPPTTGSPSAVAARPYHWGSRDPAPSSTDDAHGLRRPARPR